ncbi:MAG TPA: nucleoside recognition domain-containing protein, partial [Patescibacteria group bacterium]|nr:nucleoside recognition domain-containing protein [Patescibacteria group bacterium]
LPPASMAPRALALAAVGRDETLAGWLKDVLPPGALDLLEETVQGREARSGASMAFTMQRRRLAAAEELSRQVTSKAKKQDSGLLAAMGAFTMHPIWGLPIVAAVLYTIYLFVGVFGAQTAVGWIENGLFAGFINPWVTALFDRWSPFAWLTALFVGPYGLLTMGMTYAIAIVLPIVVTFFFAFAVMEDSGYLPRLAVMLNRCFRVMGLNGRAVLPMVLGLGCDTMATLTTRILSTRKERMIVIVLLALGVPCSAQLGVVLGILAGASWKAAAIWGGVVCGVIVVVGWLTSKILPGPRSEFIMEIPPLRMPSPLNLARKTIARVEWYLKEAVPLFLLGTLFLFIADRIRALQVMERVMEPLVTGLLGLPPAATEAFIIGFLRRDFGAAGLYRLSAEGRLDAVQIVVSLVTITLFIPCIANFFMIVKEMGMRVALAVAAFIFPFAILVGAILNFILRSAGAVLT